MRTVPPASARDNPVFVTVGTTSFDALVRALDDEKIIDAFIRKDFTGLSLQIGRGSYRPRNLRDRDGFSVRVFTYAPSIDREIESAGLVISHAGAGLVFETLRSGTPLLVVVNEALMDNHQVELAEELAGRGCLRWCVPGGLVEAIEALASDGSGFEREPYDAGECRFREAMEELLFG